MNKRLVAATSFIFCTVLTLAIMLACSDDGSKSSSSSDNSENSDKARVEVKLPKIGEMVKAEKFEFTITSVTTSTKVGSEYLDEKAPEGALFLILNYKSKNITKETMSSSDIPKIKKIIDPNGTEYSEASSATMYYKTAKGIDEKIISKLNPGITEKSAVVFEVSSDLWKQKGWKAIVDADDDLEFEIK